MGIQIGGVIEKVDGKELSYGEFAEKYLAKNQPVILTGLMNYWKACTDWVCNDGQPNIQFFSTHFGKSRVQVADCGTREFTDQKRVEMSVSEFFDHWLKDPAKECDNGADHEPNGTWTPLHADVFRSYSWSANVCGKKRWLFLSPSQSHLVFDRSMKNSVYNIFEDISEIKFPGFKKAIWLECIQERNEIIFVPSGWYHQVHNLEDTISINHNWFNAYNLSWVWDLLLWDYKEAKTYIEDIKNICDDFEGLCQRNLAANTGMNFNDFSIFITRFSFANTVLLYHLHTKTENLSFTSSSIAQHLLFNLTSTQKIAEKITSLEDHSKNNNNLLDFKETLNDPKFLRFYADLGRTYEIIHKLQSSNFDINSTLLVTVFTQGFGSKLCSLDDLVKFIDYVFSYFRENFDEEIFFESVF